MYRSGRTYPVGILGEDEQPRRTKEGEGWVYADISGVGAWWDVWAEVSRGRRDFLGPFTDAPRSMASRSTGAKCCHVRDRRQLMRCNDKSSLCIQRDE